MLKEPGFARKLRAKAQWKLALVMSKIPDSVMYTHCDLLNNFVAALAYNAVDFQHLEQRIQAIPDTSELYTLLEHTSLCDMTHHLVACRTALTEYIECMSTIVM
jgi:hypothetical protein